MQTHKTENPSLSKQSCRNSIEYRFLRHRCQENGAGHRHYDQLSLETRICGTKFKKSQHGDDEESASGDEVDGNSECIVGKEGKEVEEKKKEEEKKDGEEEKDGEKKEKKGKDKNIERLEDEHEKCTNDAANVKVVFDNDYDNDSVDDGEDENFDSGDVENDGDANSNENGDDDVDCNVGDEDGDDDCDDDGDDDDDDDGDKGGGDGDGSDDNGDKTVVYASNAGRNNSA